MTVLRRAVNILLCLTIVLNPASAFAYTAANQGITGLWEYPTAEIPDDGTGRFGYTNDSPYAYYFFDMAFLPWLEINARFSLFDSIQANERRYMDKAIDLKAMLWHNSNRNLWFLPSIAVGISDIMGTEVMKAYYGAATWRWGSVALTAGYGSDRYNGFYAGFEWDIANWLTFKAEYSPLDYTQDTIGSERILKQGPSDKYNVGFVIRTPIGLEGSVSRQRGDEWTFTISQRINLTGEFFGNARKPLESPGEPRIIDWDKTNKDEFISRIKSGIEQYVRVRDVDIKLEKTEDGHKLSLAYENYGHSSHAEAMARILVVLSEVMPETDELVLIAKNAGVPIVQASFPGSLMFDMRARTLREEDPLQSAVFTWSARELEDPDAEHLLARKAQHDVKAVIVYEPRLDQTLDQEYMDRWDVDLEYTGRYSHGFDGIFDVRFPIHVHVDTTDRTGLWWEKDLNDKIRINQAGLTWANHFGSAGRAWLFGEGGYLDEEWLGANLWGRYYGENGNWWIGARLAAMHDRDPYSFAGLTSGKWRYRYGRAYDDEESNQWRELAFVQAGYHFTGLDLDFEADYGSFADNDKGYKLAVTRHWDDVALGFWYIDTDINAPGKDFTRAGIHLELPAERWFGSWFGNSSSRIWEQNTMLQSSWNMESGREGGTIRTPERMMSQFRPTAMKRNVERLVRSYCSYDENGDDEKNTQEIRSLLEYITR